MINKILISKEKRKAINSYNKFIGMEGENLQEVLLFSLNEKIEGTGKVEVELPDGTKGIIDTNNTEEGFELPIKSSLLAQTGFVKFQLRILQNEEVIFKSDIIELRVKESINATDTIPDEYPTWIDIADKKISEIDEQIEESEKQSSYAKEQGDYAKEKADEVKNLNTEYIENALEKTKSFNENAQKKTDDYNSNSTEKMKAFNDNADSKLEEYNKNATDKTNIFNSNVETKTTEFNNNATNRTNTYNTNATVKQKAFDNNVTTKTATFNNNTTTKTNEFNQNATDKLKEYNDNATDKINKYDEHVAEKTEKDKLQDEEIETIKQKDTSQDKLILELQKENASLKEENKNIKNQFPTGTASGNVIHLEDSSDLEFDWKLRGGSKQEIREGYNKLKNEAVSKAENGINITVNGDKSINIKGTTSAKTQLYLVGHSGSKTEVLKLESGKNYKNLSGINLVYRKMNGDYGKITNNQVITFQEDCVITEVYIEFASDVTFNNTYYPMIIEGTTDKPYEQYGAMPSPDYPSEIQTVKDSVEIKVCNKNIINLEDFLKANNRNIFETYNNVECLKLHGITVEIPIQAKENTQYTFQFETKGFSSIPNIGGFLFKYTDGTSSEIWYFSSTESAGKYTKTSTTGKTLKSILWNAWSMGNCVYIDKNSIQLEQRPTNSEPVEHQEDSVIMPIQKEMLEGDWIDDKEHHGWGKIVLDGSGNQNDWILTDNTSHSDTILRFSSSISDSNIAMVNSTAEKTMICDRANCEYIGNSYTKECIAPHLNVNNKTQVNIFINKNRLTEESVTAFKAFLASNNYTIKYKLAEPEILELTEEQKQAREKILKTYKNITNISVDNELASLDVTYKKDLETMLNNINKAVIGG